MINSEQKREKEHRRYVTRPSHVYFFGTCLIDLFYPEAGLHGIQLLEREGIEVIYPDTQSCCGQPAYNSGYDEEARKVAQAQINCFPEDLPVIVPSASCASMICHQYPALFAGTPPSQAARDLASRTFELTEFLLHICQIKLTDKGLPVKVALHNSCSAQRQLRVDQCSSKLLQQLTNVAPVQQERAQECCGFGGTFAIKAPEIANAMVQDKCDNLLATGAELLLTGDCGCLMNISGALEKRQQNDGQTLPAKHIATFIWERTN